MRAHPSGRDRGRAEPDAARIELARGIKGNRVAVDRDADGVEGFLHLASGQVERAQVDQHQVVVGATAYQAEPALAQPFRQDPGVVDHRLRVGTELRRLPLGEHDRLAGDRMVMWAALASREDALVDIGGEFRLAEDHRAPGTAHRLVRREAHEVGVRHRAWMSAARDQTREVRHVDEEIRVNRVRDGGHPLEVEDARVRAVTREQHLGAHLARLLLEHVVIDPLGVRIDAVRHEVIELAGEIHRAAVTEVAAVAQVHAHHRVARIEHGRVDRIVGGRPTVRLHVGMLGVEERLGTFDRERLDPIDVLAAAVVALSWVPLGVLVVEQRAERLQNRRAGDVLGGNQFQGVLLALELVADRGADLGIDGIDPAGQVGSSLQHRLIIPESSASPERRHQVAGMSWSAGIAPWRRIRGSGCVRSRIVDGSPIRQGPPSRTRSRSSPRPAITASASIGGAAPARFALLLASGSSSASSKASASGCSGARTASVGWPAAGSAGSTSVSGPGQYRRINPAASSDTSANRSTAWGPLTNQTSGCVGGRRFTA